MERVSEISAVVEKRGYLPHADFDRLQSRLDEVAHQLAAALQTVQTQQQEIVGLRRTIEVVTRTQERMNTNVLTVQREVGSRSKGVQREVESLTRLLLSKAQDEQEQLRAQLQSLTIANDRLTKEIADLGTQNRELKDRLKSAGVDVSKATPAAATGPAMAGKPKTENQSTQIAESRSDAGRSPFTFWVSFQDGTSEESIQHLIDEIRGRRGSAEAGWYPVEIMPSPPEPPDLFLESLRHAKIVKAVSTTHVAGPSR
jgi:septal ring factor EnvC (AmiA/AmiB activator)